MFLRLWMHRIATLPRAWRAWRLARREMPGGSAPPFLMFWRAVRDV